MENELSPDEIKLVQAAATSIAAMPRQSTATADNVQGIARLIGDKLLPFYTKIFSDPADITGAPENARWLIVAAKFTLGMHELFIEGRIKGAEEPYDGFVLSKHSVASIVVLREHIDTIIQTMAQT
jgi:hypothetical protein